MNYELESTIIELTNGMIWLEMVFSQIYFWSPKNKKLWRNTPPPHPPYTKMVVNVFWLVRTVKLSDLFRRTLWRKAYLKKICLKLRNNFCETLNTSLLLWTNGAHLIVQGFWSYHDGLLSRLNVLYKFA